MTAELINELSQYVFSTQDEVSVLKEKIKALETIVENLRKHVESQEKKEN